MYLLLSFILSLLTGLLFCDVSIVVNAGIFLFIGWIMVQYMSAKANRTLYHKIYGLCFFVYFAYAVICYCYKEYNGFQTMFVMDNITAYIPYANKLSRFGFFEMWDKIYYPTEEISGYKHCGWILILFAYIIKLTNVLGTESYLNLQVSIIFFSSFIPVFVYKLLRQYAVRDSYKWTLFYAFCSILAYYSSLVLRDIPIALAYIIALCYIPRGYSLRNCLVFSLVFIAVLGLRPQAAMFMLLFTCIPVVNTKGQVSRLVAFVFVVLAVGLLIVMFDGVEQMETTEKGYRHILQTRQNDSTLNALNALPPVLSHIAKIVYILMSPIPSWSYMEWGDASTGLNNMLGFTRAIGAYYNYIIIVFMIYGVWNFKRLRISKIIWLMTGLGLLFVMVQSNSTELRRIMAGLPLLLLFAAKVYSLVSKSQRVKLFISGGMLFVVFQAIGLLKYL